MPPHSDAQYMVTPCTWTGYVANDLYNTANEQKHGEYSPNYIAQQPSTLTTPK